MTGPGIHQEIRQSTIALIDYCKTIHPKQFFHQPEVKWSIAQNVRHLIISANTTRIAYALPHFILRLYTGKPNRPSRSYDELVARYKQKLELGGKASGRFVPKNVAANTHKEKWLDDFCSSMNRLEKIIARQHEDDLDRYLAPHPLLGKITLRELAYFTIYHTHHHLQIIKDRMAEFPHSG